MSLLYDLEQFELDDRGQWIDPGPIRGDGTCGRYGDELKQKPAVNEPPKVEPAAIEPRSPGGPPTDDALPSDSPSSSSAGLMLLPPGLEFEDDPDVRAALQGADAELIESVLEHDERFRGPGSTGPAVELEPEDPTPALDRSDVTRSGGPQLRPSPVRRASAERLAPAPSPAPVASAATELSEVPALDESDSSPTSAPSSSTSPPSAAPTATTATPDPADQWRRSSRRTTRR
jgi:hypothetical protein